MGDGLVEAVLGHADGGRADVELADVHGVERRIPCARAPGEQVVRADGIVVQGKVGHVLLVGNDVLLQLVSLVPVVGHEEGVVVGAVLDLAQGGDHLGFVAVADVVLLAVRHPGAVRPGCEGGLGCVDVGAVRPLGEAEGEDRPLLEKLGGPAFRRFVCAHPDRPQPQDAHLEAVPVAQPVERQQFAVFAVAGRVPTAVRVAAGVRPGGEQLGKDLLPGNEIDKPPVPHLPVEVFGQPGLAHVLEKGDGLVHDGTRAGVGREALVLSRLQ